MSNDDRRFTPRLADLVSFTTLAAAVVSMGLSIDGRIQLAALLILAGYLLDGVDGSVARRLGGFSEFGTQLDSLIDVVHFGAAASILISQHLRAGPVDGWPLWLLLTGYMFAACYRLARFNLTAHANDKQETVGLTISTAGAFLALAVLFHLTLGNPAATDWVFLPLLACLSLLMASRIAFPDLGGLPKYRLPMLLTFAIGAVVAIWASIEAGLLLVWLIYLLFGMLRTAVRITRRRSRGLESHQKSIDQRSSA